MYQELADMACERITRGIVSQLVGESPVKAVLDPYNPTGSTIHVNFTTSKKTRWKTDPRRCHINWVVCDSDWEAEFCRVAEAHPRVRAYAKNHNLGLEVPYRYKSEARWYRPDFVVLVDDGRGPEDLLHLVVEIKGYRREDAKEKKSTMETYWVPGVNHLGSHGRWAFVELTDAYQIETDFEAKIEGEFAKMIDRANAEQD
jgi:type III restriction enzyme